MVQVLLIFVSTINVRWKEGRSGRLARHFEGLAGQAMECRNVLRNFAAKPFASRTSNSLTDFPALKLQKLKLVKLNINIFQLIIIISAPSPFPPTYLQISFGAKS